jgi:hypothetical protein
MENRPENYMFFKNIQQIARQAKILQEMDPKMLDSILQHGHDWADDHISVAKENMDQVFDFFMNKTENQPHSDSDSDNHVTLQFENTASSFSDFVKLNEKKRG